MFTAREMMVKAYETLFTVFKKSALEGLADIDYYLGLEKLSKENIVSLDNWNKYKVSRYFFPSDEPEYISGHNDLPTGGLFFRTEAAYEELKDGIYDIETAKAIVRPDAYIEYINNMIYLDPYWVGEWTEEGISFYGFDNYDSAKRQLAVSESIPDCAAVFFEMEDSGSCRLFYDNELYVTEHKFTFDVWGYAENCADFKNSATAYEAYLKLIGEFAAEEEREAEKYECECPRGVREYYRLMDMKDIYGKEYAPMICFMVAFDVMLSDSDMIPDYFVDPAEL